VFNKKEQKALLFLIFLIIAGVFVVVSRDCRTEPFIEVSKGRQPVEVFMCGKVLRPGVYKFLKTETLGHMLKLSGIIQDACGKIVFTVLNSDESVNMPINLNTASGNELESLPSIGPVLALNIIKYRDIHGNFGSREEIMRVRGIGIKKFRLISDSIFVSDKKAGKVPDGLEIELKGVKKEGTYKIGSSATIADILNLVNCRHFGSAGGILTKGTSLKFLRFEVK
jgi:competence ComEA-like helix-hairpin-helix protein